jgi:hypothetical protein
VVDAHQSEHKLIWSKALLRGNTLQTVDPVVCKSRFDSPGEFPKKVVQLFRCSFIVSSFKLTHFTKLSPRSRKPKLALVIHTSFMYPSRGFGGRNNWTSNTGQSYWMHKPYSPYRSWGPCSRHLPVLILPISASHRWAITIRISLTVHLQT